MAPSIAASGLAILGLFTLLAPISVSADDTPNPCVVDGVDFQDQGTYFQNSASTDLFSFVQVFKGCEDDSSMNMLIDPQGNQISCDSTPMTPPDVAKYATCQIQKNQLYSGEWTIAVYSDNGNAQPIAYMREFNLIVGPQVTTTVTPTVTVPVTSTPTLETTTTTTDTILTTLPALTTTVASSTRTRTYTTTPKRVIVTSTKTVFTKTQWRHSVTVVKTTKSVFASCTVPPLPPTHDRRCTIRPTLPAYKTLDLQAMALPIGSAKYRRVADLDKILSNKAKYLAERNARLAAAAAAPVSDNKRALVKRAPDPATVTSTDTNTADYVTVTTTIFAPTTTIVTNTDVDVTSTVTPSPVTVMSGKRVVVVMVTAPTPTRTKVKYTTARVTSTKVVSYTVVITSTVKPSALAKDCRRHGGYLN